LTAEDESEESDIDEVTPTTSDLNELEQLEQITSSTLATTEVSNVLTYGEKVVIIVIALGTMALVCKNQKCPNKFTPNIKPIVEINLS
jgi:hypothetical protein